MKRIFIMLFCFFISSCNFLKKNDELSQSDLKYLIKLHLIEKEEKVIWFDSQLDKKTSGNFLTNKRIASYWIDKYNKSQSYKNFFLLKDIDSLKLINLSNSVTNSSYIKAYSKGKILKIYIDKDSIILNKYFNKALQELKGFNNN